MSKALTQDEKASIVSQIEVNFDGNNLAFETMAQIVEASIAFMASDFEQLTWDNRDGNHIIAKALCSDFIQQGELKQAIYPNILNIVRILVKA